MIQLAREGNYEEVPNYLKTNWFEMVKPNQYKERKRRNSGDNLRESEEIVVPNEDEEDEALSEKQIHALKLYVLNCSAWDARRMNLLSVVLLIICCTIDEVGKLWVNFLCLNYQ